VPAPQRSHAPRQRINWKGASKALIGPGGPRLRRADRESLHGPLGQAARLGRAGGRGLRQRHLAGGRYGGSGPGIEVILQFPNGSANLNLTAAGRDHRAGAAPASVRADRRGRPRHEREFSVSRGMAANFERAPAGYLFPEDPRSARGRLSSSWRRRIGRGDPRRCRKPSKRIRKTAPASRFALVARLNGRAARTSDRRRGARRSGDAPRRLRRPQADGGPSAGAWHAPTAATDAQWSASTSVSARGPSPSTDSCRRYRPQRHQARQHAQFAPEDPDHVAPSSDWDH